MNTEEESQAGVEECACVGGDKLEMVGQGGIILPVHNSHPCPIACLHELRM